MPAPAIVNHMFEMQVEDIFTISGRGTVFLGTIRSGAVSVGDNVVCKTPQAEVFSRVIGLEEPKSGRAMDRAEANSATIAVVCKTIDHKTLVGAWQGEGEGARVVGVTLSPGAKKRWWQS